MRHFFPARNYLFKVNNRKTRKMGEICSKLIIKKLTQRKWRRSRVIIVDFEHIFTLLKCFYEFKEVIVFLVGFLWLNITTLNLAWPCLSQKNNQYKQSKETIFLCGKNENSFFEFLRDNIYTQLLLLTSSWRYIWIQLAPCFSITMSHVWQCSTFHSTAFDSIHKKKIF